jgi:hypothetical protein
LWITLTDELMVRACHPNSIPDFKFDPNKIRLLPSANVRYHFKPDTSRVHPS